MGDGKAKPRTLSQEIPPKSLILLTFVWIADNKSLILLTFIYLQKYPPTD